ncbi:hypothetical protein [Streptomyces sp. NPDC049040]|uniref:hypothetical protein n=1 Tax=Streptomyces sp. NPDC049040 TaxID=3365593 RepID=UPI003712F58A
MAGVRGAVGVLYAVQGAGSIMAGTVAGAVMRRLPEHAFAAVGLLLFTAGAAVRAVPSLPVVLAGTLAIGVGLPWVIVAAFTAVQQRTEPALVGRVAAAAGTLVFAPTAVAAALGAHRAWALAGGPGRRWPAGVRGVRRQVPGRRTALTVRRVLCAATPRGPAAQRPAGGPRAAFSQPARGPGEQGGEPRERGPPLPGA